MVKRLIFILFASLLIAGCGVKEAYQDTSWKNVTCEGCSTEECQPICKDKCTELLYEGMGKVHFDKDFCSCQCIG